MFRRSAVAFLALCLAGCGSSPPGEGSGLSATLSHPPGSFFQTLLAGSRDLGPLPPGQSVSLILTLADPAAARQAADLRAMYTPHSRTFGRFQSPNRFAAHYGPSTRIVRMVRDRLTRLGLSADWRTGDKWMTVSGPARLVERAFHVGIHAYRSPRGVPYYAGSSDPEVPHALRGLVAGVGRITSFFQPTTAAVPAGGLTPTDLLKAYDIAPLRRLGLDGSGETVAFFEVDGFDQNDLNTFTGKYGLPPINPIIKAGPALSPGAETEMDLEVVHAIAPGAKLELYNLDYKTAARDAGTYPVYGTKYVVPLQDQMVTDNPRGILSLSWGICDQAWGANVASAWKSVYYKADALGESVFVSTGDSGAYECLNTLAPGTPPAPQLVSVPLPASLPGVTATGGTRLSVNRDGSRYDETVWEEPALTGGTGGGFSAYMPMPSWQQGKGVQSSLNRNNMREIPDVSADADPASGAANFLTGNWEQGGGTSQAAPIWAGITALMNQYLKSKGLQGAGFLNPALYALASGSPGFPPFHDITVGGNLFYPAGPGYDMASGLGTPDAWNLARDLESYLKSGAKVPKRSGRKP